MHEDVWHVTAPTRAVLQALLDNRDRGATGLTLGLDARLSPAIVHPLLARLENLGWVESRWQETDLGQPGGARCRYYAMTPQGAAQAQQALRAAEVSCVQWMQRRQPALGKP